ncbi:hypothetical protein [Pseudomonas sp. NBRC 111124]
MDQNGAYQSATISQMGNGNAATATQR